MKRALVLLAGCARFDPGEPIELVVDSRWNAGEVARVEAAGECWNLAFGTRFVVTREPATPQFVTVQYDDLPCIHAAGQYTPGEPARIDICPDGHFQDLSLGYQPPLFMTLVHEVGHATGIRAEGNGEYSVMGFNVQAYNAELGRSHEAFSDEDRQLLHVASPDFDIAPACASVVMRWDASSGAACFCN